MHAVIVIQCTKISLVSIIYRHKKVHDNPDIGLCNGGNKRLSSKEKLKEHIKALHSEKGNENRVITFNGMYRTFTDLLENTTKKNTIQFYHQINWPNRHHWPLY